MILKVFFCEKLVVEEFVNRRRGMFYCWGCKEVYLVCFWGVCLVCVGCSYLCFFDWF